MSSSNQGQYIRLRNLGSHTSTDDEVHAREPSNKSDLKPLRFLRRFRFGAILIIISLFFNLVGGLKLLFSLPSPTRHLTYSPAWKAVKNELVVFSSAFGIETSPFQGQPNEHNDRLWAGLYDFGISRITTDEARPMNNKTLPIPDEKGGYVVQLAVFHQLHCLNMIRKGIYGSVDMSNKDDMMGIEHLDHCIDMLRQAIMCNSDVSPTTFSRTSLDTPMKVVAEVAHTCKSFSKIQQWAWNRRILEDFNKSTVVTDDPLGWGTYTYVP